MFINNSYRRIISFLLIAVLLNAAFVFARAQQPAATPSSNDRKIELHQALLDLTNAYTVMCVAAHPDDEDGTTLTMLRRKYGVHTVSLFSTYGEGGQNAVGPELYEDLGVIRARETMAAARIQGSEPYFLGLKDFGFSKSADEAFRFWGHDEALRRMVLKLRELRPDVIITNHDTTSGHGHHQATGRLILEAFDAAADPKRFPEQLAQVKPWQAQRLFVRLFGASAPAAPAEKVVSIDPNEIDPVRNSSFIEQALTALQQHATQGPWPKTVDELIKARGGTTGKVPAIRYQLVREAPNAAPLSNSGIPFLGGLKMADSFAFDIKPFEHQDALLTDFVDQPVVVLESLIEWRKSHPITDASVDPDRAQMMKVRFDHAIATAANISLTITPEEDVFVPSTTDKLTVTLENNGDRVINIDRVLLTTTGQQRAIKMADQLLPETETSGVADVAVPNNAKISVPSARHLYDGLLFGNEVNVSADLEIDAVHFNISARTRLDVAPIVEIDSIEPSPCVFSSQHLARCEALSMNIESHSSNSLNDLKIKIEDEAGHSVIAESSVTLTPHETRTEKLTINLPVSAREKAAYQHQSHNWKVSLTKNESVITDVLVPIIYASAAVVPGLKVGYLPSFDKTLENSLAALAVQSKALSIDDVKSGNLNEFDTIIIDNRGYEAHPELIESNARLLEYVNNGGTLIVFYHKSNEWNPDPKRNRPQLAPYPILLGDERVTDETAALKFLQPSHPLMNVPNKIKLSDFDNWIQERGLYYPKEWDSHYTALFSTNDPGEKPLTGGLLVAKYGKGNYIYTSMVWYRQLRQGIPGAFRMFANMISYGKK